MMKSRSFILKACWLLCIIVGIGISVHQYTLYRKSQEAYDMLRTGKAEQVVYQVYEVEETVVNDMTHSAILEKVEGPVEVALEEVFIPEMIWLYEQNADTVGWLKIEETTIDYPILQGEDNAYYLKHNFYQEASIAGSIFMDYRNNSRFEDPNTVLYGHHMKDGSMFRDLIKLRKQDFIDKKPHIFLTTLYEEWVYEIVSVYVIESTYDYRDDYKDIADFEDFLTRIQSLSIVETGTEPLTVEDHILTLSTCIYDFYDARLVVHGRQTHKNYKEGNTYIKDK